MPNITCKQCGKTATVKPKSSKRKPAIFCGNECRLAWMALNRPWNFKGGRHLKQNGYVETLVDGGLRGEHVAVAERALGKPLPVGAVVHHHDGNKSNNTNTNLVICQDIAYHSLIHYRMRVLARGGDPNTQRLCSVCVSLKPIEDFYRRKNRAEWSRLSECKHCMMAKNRKRADAMRAARAGAARGR